METTAILGLDMAQKTGWSLWRDGKYVASGVQDFTKRRGESNGILFLRFRKWLHDFMTEHGPFLALVYERAHMRGGPATEIGVGLQTHAQSTAEELGVLSVGVPTGTLKRFATGAGNAGKPEMIAAAAVITGGNPATLTDDEADAVFVGKWGCCELVPGA